MYITIAYVQYVYIVTTASATAASPSTSSFNAKDDINAGSDSRDGRVSLNKSFFPTRFDQIRY